MSELRATVRLQFHRDFTFEHAIELIPYFSQLGITHIYASPILKARAGSVHGYDVVDPTQVNPELGGEALLEKFSSELKKHDMGLIVDVVSNHMAVGGDDNPWWLDVLKWGQKSRYATFFDIEWNSPDSALQGMILVPFLLEDYGEVLQSGEICIHFDDLTGEFYLVYRQHRLPLNPASYSHILSHSKNSNLQQLSTVSYELENNKNYLKDAEHLHEKLCEIGNESTGQEDIKELLNLYKVTIKKSGAIETPKNNRLNINTHWPKDSNLNRLHNLLELQCYRLASWGTAIDDLNWRRFFDINELAGIRVERQDVFESMHEKLFYLIEKGIVNGLRIDHIDGFANPRTYCRKLRRRVNQLMPSSISEESKEFFPIYVEKILTGEEKLSNDWMVDGTTGYEFMNLVSLLQHNPAGFLPLGNLWNQRSGRGINFVDEIKEAKRFVLSSLLGADVEFVARGLLTIARTNIMTRDVTLGSIRRALIELVAHFPVYRTYVTVCGRTDTDKQYFDDACKGAKAALKEIDWPVLEYISLWLGEDRLHDLPLGKERDLRRRILTRFQQLTSPAAAKSIEDTACYRSAVLLSRNDVGFDPQRFNVTPLQFHERNIWCGEYFPHNLLITASHDHKRGEDTRARIAVISERFLWFSQKIDYWKALAAPLKSEVDGTAAPSDGDELILYQTLLGCWPLDLDIENSEAVHEFLQRLLKWQEKSIREAKLHSYWCAPNQHYESVCRDFLTALLTAESTRELRRDIAQAAFSLAPAGAINSLSQTLLRMTCPGVPDLYQGTEFWDFSLVEPDNRRPVNFQARVEALKNASFTSPPEFLERWQDGHIKQWLIKQTLSIRKRYPAVFMEGDYLPLEVNGEYADRIIAFLRQAGDICLIVVISRFNDELLQPAATPLIPAHAWKDTAVILPPYLASYIVEDSLTAEVEGRVSDGILYVKDILATLPCYLSISIYTEQT